MRRTTIAVAVALLSVQPVLAQQHGHSTTPKPTTHPSTGHPQPTSTSHGPSTHGTTGHGNTTHGSTHSSTTTQSSHGHSSTTKPKTTKTPTNTSAKNTTKSPSSNGSSKKAGNSSTTTGSTTTGTGTSTPLSPVQQKLQTNTKLASKLSGRLGGADAVTSAAGFRNLGQFVAAVNVSNNLGIPFADLKSHMVDDGMSLGQSIQKLKPAANSTVEAQRAEHDADVEIRTTVTMTKTPTTSTTTTPTTAKTPKKTSSGGSQE